MLLCSPPSEDLTGVCVSQCGSVWVCG